MQRMQGPRDWMPPPELPQPRTAYACPDPSPVARPRRGLGVLSFLLGAGAAVLAIGQSLPAATDTGFSGYLVSTIGITAVVLGVTAIRRRGRGTLPPALGILLGAFGTAFMVALMMQFHGGTASTQIELPTVTTPTVPLKPQEPALQPVVEVPAPAPADERMQLAQAAGTVSYLLTKGFEINGSYPTVLQATSTGMVVTTFGNLQLPKGSQLLYEPSISGSGYSLTITGANGAVAKYDTATGGVTLD